jgi:hypothetical protein
VAIDRLLQVAIKSNNLDAIRILTEEINTLEPERKNTEGYSWYDLAIQRNNDFAIDMLNKSILDKSPNDRSLNQHFYPKEKSGQCTPKKEARFLPVLKKNNFVNGDIHDFNATARK